MVFFFEKLYFQIYLIVYPFQSTESIILHDILEYSYLWSQTLKLVNFLPNITEHKIS